MKHLTFFLSASLFCLALLCTGLFSSARAATYYSDNTYAALPYLDDVNIYLNDPTTPPGTGDSLSLRYNGTNDYSFYYRYDSAAVPTFASVLVDNTNAGDYVTILRNTTTITDPLLYTDELILGDRGQANFIHTRGQVRIGEQLLIGNESTAEASYDISSGSLTSLNGAFRLRVGNYGKGTVNQTGGLVEIGGGNHTDGNMVLGTYANSLGTYNLSGGTLRNHLVTSSSLPTDAIVGYYGKGVFNQSGGTHIVNDTLFIGGNAGSEGTYTLTGGTLTQEDGSLNVQVGYSGNGSFIQDGGNADLGTGALTIGRSASSTGTYQLNGADDTLTADHEYIGYSGNGSFTQNSGLNLVDIMFIAYWYDSEGAYEMNGGRLQIDTGMVVGYSGIGSFYHDSYSATVSASGDGIIIGSRENSQGTYHLHRGSIITSAITVGRSGTGTFIQDSGSVSVGQLEIKSTEEGSGSYTLNDGGLEAIGMRNNDTFTMNGGALSSAVDNRGAFKFYGGTISGSFENNGALYLYDDLMFTGDLINNTSFSLSSGRTLNISGTLQNNSALDINGAQVTLSTADSRMDNSGQARLTESTVVGPGSVNNFGILSQSYGAMTFANTGGVNNYGTMDLQSGYQTRLNGTDLNNYAGLNLEGGIITGTGSILNQAGGTISGTGTITTEFSNQGRLLVGAGNTTASAGISNAGQIQMVDDYATLNGGAIRNTGTIEGRGMIGNNIMNSGTIEARNGTLTLGGTLTTATSSLITAAAGAKVLVSRGLADNQGIINLNGGTFDTNNQIMINTGQISGHGILRTGGMSNRNKMLLTGGNTTVNGDIINSGTITAAYNPVTFTGDVINNGIFKNTETTVTFAGNYTENGTYISDPAVNYLENVTIGTTGALIGGEEDGRYDKWFISNDFINNSTRNDFWNTVDAFLGFTGLLDGNQDVYLAGQDEGAILDGYLNNFAWGYVDIADITFLNLFDGNQDNDGTALYVEVLTGISVSDDIVMNISGDGNIYYLSDLEENAYLEGLTYDFSDGLGQLIPVLGMPASQVPVPGSLWIFAAGLLGLAGVKRKSLSPPCETGK